MAYDPAGRVKIRRHHAAGELIVCSQRPPFRVEDYAARVFVAAAVLNANNIVYMATGIRQTGTVIMLISCITVIARVGQASLSLPFNLFALSILSYIVFGNFFYDSGSVESTDTSYSLTFAGTLLGVWAVASYTMHAAFQGSLEHYKSFIKTALLISTASIYLSPLLLPFWSYPPLASEERLSGFFGNPNEAGFIACGALVFVMLNTQRAVWIKAALIAFCIGGLVLSFSKTAITVGIVISTIALVQSLRGLAFFIVPAAAVMLVVFVQDPVAVIEALVDESFIDLSGEQRERIISIGRIVAGQIDDKVTTGRTELWEIGLQRIADRFPMGYGFDTFHHLVGGRYFLDSWLGIHNTPLMLLGEGGIVPFVFFLLCLIVITARLLSAPEPMLAGLLFFVLLADYNSNHSALEIRYANVYLGLIIALTSFRPYGSARSSRAEGPH